MRLRFRSISYTVGRTPASLERHYRELREAMLRAGQHYGLQPDEPWRPPIDIHETPDAIQVKIEMAGVREEDIDVTLYENALVVSGQRHNDVSPDDFVYYHEAQVRYGPFRADVLLPCAIESDAVVAAYEQGFLRVRLPKAKPASVEARGEGGQTRDTEDEQDDSDNLAGGQRESMESAVGAAVVRERIVNGGATVPTRTDPTTTRAGASVRAN